MLQKSDFTNLPYLLLEKEEIMKQAENKEPFLDRKFFGLKVRQIFIFAILFLVSRIVGFVYLAVVTIRNTSKEIKDSYQKTIDKNKEKLKNLNYTNPVTEYDNHGNEITQL